MKLAQQKDIPELIDLLENFYRISPYSNMVSYDKESTRDTLTNLMDNGFVLMDGKSVIGVIFYPLSFNKDFKVAQEIFWYSEEKGKGKRLLEKTEELCKEFKVNALTMLSIMEMDRLEDFYLRHGYKRSERSYMKVF